MFKFELKFVKILRIYKEKNRLFRLTISKKEKRKENLKFESNLLQRSIDTCRDYSSNFLFFRFNFIHRLNSDDRKRKKIKKMEKLFLKGSVATTNIPGN